MTTQSIPCPTKDELQRDLAADLPVANLWQASGFASTTAGWPTAIRRAIWAEAEVERLKKVLDEIWWAVSAGQDNASCDEPHATIRRMVDEALTNQQ